MSQDMRNPANEGNGSSGRSTNENVRNDEQKRFEGFEGMNYEQRRGPYNPQRNGGRRGNNSSPDNNPKRED